MIKKNIKKHFLLENNVNSLTISGPGLTLTQGLNIVMNDGTALTQPIRYCLSIQRNQGVKRFYVNLLNPISYVYNNNFNREWLPLHLKITDSINCDSPQEWFQDWFFDDQQQGTFLTLEKINPTGEITGCYNFHNSFLQELNNEVVFDRLVNPIEIKIKYANMNVLF
jgi:hypothetical protein